MAALFKKKGQVVHFNFPLTAGAIRAGTMKGLLVRAYSPSILLNYSPECTQLAEQFASTVGHRIDICTPPCAFSAADAIGFRVKMAQHAVKSFADLDSLALANCTSESLHELLEAVVRKAHMASEYWPCELPVAGSSSIYVKLVCHLVSCDCVDALGWLHSASAAVNSLSSTLNSKPSWKPVQFAVFVRLKSNFGTTFDLDCDLAWQEVGRLFSKNCGQVFLKDWQAIGREDMESIAALIGAFAMRTVLPFLKNYATSADFVPRAVIS